MANGTYSFALGEGSKAKGDFSISIGGETEADAYNQFVIGRYNEIQGTANPHTWTGNDDLFIIGNGTAAQPHNAFKVKQNGDTAITGTLTVNGTATANGRALLTAGEGSYTASGATAFGDYATAGGNSSVALGGGTQAYGHNSVAIGPGSTVYNDESVAVGNGVFLGSWGGGNAAFGVGIDGYCSSTTLLGVGSMAWNTMYGTAVGYANYIEAVGASAFGNSNNVQADYSTIVGVGNVAFGKYSSALGSNTVTTGFGEVVLGQYNEVGGGPVHDEWFASDRLLVVGNGKPGEPSNALVVQKNGDTAFSGSVSVNQDLNVAGRVHVVEQGDISMGEFHAEPP